MGAAYLQMRLIHRRLRYYTVGYSKYYYEDWADHDYLLCSSKTAFDMHLLKKFGVKILEKLSFKEKTDIYNNINELSGQSSFSTCFSGCVAWEKQAIG